MWKQDDGYLRLAIELSEKALQAGNLPFGAIAVRGEEEVGRAQNTQRTQRDPTAHAELVLVRELVASRGPEALAGATVYVSGEPCPMCAGALFWAGVARIVFAATSEDIQQALGLPALPMRAAGTLAGCDPPISVVSSSLRGEAASVLQRFAGGGRAARRR